MHVLGLIIAVVAGAEKQAEVPPLVAPPLTSPPLVAADEEGVAPTAPRRVVTRAAPVKLSERVTPAAAAAPASRFGIIALAGAEVAVPVNGAAPLLGLRAGMGVRFALLERSEDQTKVNATPSVAVVAGYSGLVEHRVFTEVRTELVAASGGGMFLPGFTVYALSGLGTHLNGDGVDPYVGLGIGWDHSIFEASDSPSQGKQRWGGGWGGLSGGGGQGAAILLAGVVAVAAVIGFVCVGRLEIRYHPSPPHRAPQSVSVLIGFGL